jgi:hypothetical protein
MQFSTDQRHADTLTFLGEVRDYIATWPAHPINKETTQRIKTHLDEPCHRLVRDALHLKTGFNVDPTGRLVLNAELIGDTLTLSRSFELRSQISGRPLGSKELVAESVLLARLRLGEVITLSPDKTLVREKS